MPVQQQLVSDHIAGTLSELDQEVVRHVPAGGNWRDLPNDFPSKRVQQIRESAAAGGGSRSTYYGRLTWPRPSYTISTYISRPGNGCHIHPEYDRLITIREAARLQSFPDAVTFTGSNRARAQQVGNAVPPLLAYAIATVLEAGTFVDLFSGAGGFSLGFSWAGHEMVGAVDFDADANETAARAHNTDRIITADLSDPTRFDQVMRDLQTAAGGRIDTLIGGPPCQGFSTAGNGDLSDTRNDLVFSFLEAVERLGPRVVLMENVPALLWRGRGILDQIRHRLHTLGYGTSVIIAHAEAYGVPQLRRRLLLQGVADDIPMWPTPTHQLMDPAHPSNQPGSDLGSVKPVGVKDAIGDLPATAAESSETLVPVEHPSSNYQEWAQGHLSIQQLVPGLESIHAEDLDLFTTSSTR